MGYLESNHWVFDIETLGVEPGCPIIQIGIVKVNRENDEWKTREVFNKSISIGSNLVHGFNKISQDTLNFWHRNAESLKEILKCPALGMFDVIEDLVKTINSNRKPTDIFWSKGHFDFPILERAIGYFDWKVPWKYNELMDIRTIQDSLFMGSYIPLLNNHIAIFDALNEAELLVEVLKRMERLKDK